MQTIPGIYNLLKRDVFSAVENREPRTSGFNALEDFGTKLQDALSKSGKSTQTAVNVQGPYTRNTSDGLTYTLSEVCFTKQDLQELRQELLQAGAPSESLATFDKLAELPGGATLSQVMLSLKNINGMADLSDEDAKSITALINAVDPSGELSFGVLHSLYNQDSEGALRQITTALEALPAGENLEVAREGFAALGRALGLNETNQQSLQEALNSEQATLLPAQFSALVSIASDQFTLDKGNLQKLQTALDKTLSPIIRKARQRMEKEEAANSLANRKVAQSKTMIDRSVQQKTRETLFDALDQENDPDDFDRQNFNLSVATNGRDLDQLQNSIGKPESSAHLNVAEKKHLLDRIRLEQIRKEMQFNLLNPALLDFLQSIQEEPEDNSPLPEQPNASNANATQVDASRGLPDHPGLRLTSPVQPDFQRQNWGKQEENFLSQDQQETPQQEQNFSQEEQEHAFEEEFARREEELERFMRIGLRRMRPDLAAALDLVA